MRTSLQPIRIIVARELRDMLSDWRLLLPILILSIFFPTLLVGGSNIIISFIGDPELVETIIPFAMLLIGFIPASFSLITALETFVGERERNSLEALLSMPVGDGQLYLSKLISSLLPPMGSALFAMTVFAVELRAFQPALFFGGLEPDVVATIALLVVAKSCLMVAGAVIISSHTSNIRAANLLASFVLLPTAALIQVEALYIIADLWGALRILALVLFMAATMLIRTGMGAFNREEILSREHDQLSLKRTWQTFRSFLRQYQPVIVEPARYSDASFSLRRFYGAELPALLRDYRLPILMALIGAVSGIVIGAVLGDSQQPRLDRFLARQIGQVSGVGLPFTLGILFNNIRVSLLSTLFSLPTFGFFAFMVPTVAFGQVSFITSALAARGGEWLALNQSSPLQFLLGYVLPHGLIELPAAVLSAAMGIRIGASLLANQPGVTVGRNILWSIAQYLKVWALVLLPMFLLGSIIEGFISPLVVRALYG